jgi:hypothetical protein
MLIMLYFLIFLVATPMYLLYENAYTAFYFWTFVHIKVVEAYHYNFYLFVVFDFWENALLLHFHQFSSCEYTLEIVEVN